MPIHHLYLLHVQVPQSALQEHRAVQVGKPGVRPIRVLLNKRDHHDDHDDHLRRR
jgi:hypothetical protein